MTLNIQPLHDNELDCFEDSIATLVRWMNFDIELMFAYLWEFRYNSEGSGSISKLGDRITPSDTNLFHSLQDFTGLIFYRPEKCERNCIEIIIKEIEKGAPVLANIDTFSCPFSIEFQKVHVIHSIIIVGIDYEKSSFICIDPFYQLENLPFEFNSFNESMHSFYIIKIEKNLTINLNWRKLIEDVCNKQYFEDAFNNMIKFSEALLQLPSLKAEIDGYDDLNQSPLIGNLFAIKKQRINFGIFLHYLGDKFNIPELNTASDTFKLLGSKWLIIRGLIIKCAFSINNSLLKKAELLIKEVANLEEKAAENLLQLCKADLGCEAAAQDSNDSDNKSQSIEKIFYVPLDDYFNNTGFGNTDNGSIASFTNTGAFFLDSGIPKSEIWSIHTMKFRFPFLGAGIKDNVSCEGQAIPVSPDNYRQILFLGCAEWGNFYDALTIFYANNTVENLPIQFTDWVLAPNKNEFTAWEGNGCENKNGNIVPSIFKHRIFAKSYSLNPKDAIEKIELPNCPNIHIFAISLCK